MPFSLGVARQLVASSKKTTAHLARALDLYRTAAGPRAGRAIPARSHLGTLLTLAVLLEKAAHPARDSLHVPFVDTTFDPIV